MSIFSAVAHCYGLHIGGCFLYAKLTIPSYVAVRHAGWELGVSLRHTDGHSCGQTRTTRRVTWEMSGRSPLLAHPTPRALCWRRCKQLCTLSSTCLPTGSSCDPMLACQLHRTRYQGIHEAQLSEDQSSSSPVLSCSLMSSHAPSAEPAI